MTDPHQPSGEQAAIEQLQSRLEEVLQSLASTPEGAQALAEIEPARIDAEYAVAWQAMASGDMVAAADAFGSLALKVSDQYRVQFGWALCLQHFGLVEDAGRHYGLAYLLDPSSAACAYRLGECLLATGQIEDAREALLTAIQLCDVPGADPDIRGHAQAALDLLTS